MIFTALVFLAAFALEAIGSYVSIVGLSALFAANIVVIVLAGCLDFAKIVTVSFLYKHWQGLGWMMKTYLTSAAIVLMIITSAGAFGFLSGEFQKAIADTGTQAIKIQTLEEEKGRLQKRKEEIDTQIAKLPDNAVRGRRQLMQQFGPEVTRLNSRLATIDTELPALKIQNVEKETHAGPILYVAKAFNTTPETAVTFVIMTIIFVFDPLAVALLIAGNFLLDRRKKVKVEELVEEPKKWPCRICGEENGSLYFAEKCEASHQAEGAAGQMSEHINVGGKTFNIDERATDEEVQRVRDFIKSMPENDKEPESQRQELELVPIEEPQEDDCRYCGGDGEHYVGPSQYVDCEACTPQPEEALEPIPEDIVEVTPPNPTPPRQQITVEEINGRDVISLGRPRSTLEDANLKLADIVEDGASGSAHTMKLRTYYNDDSPIEPVVAKT